MSKKPKKVKTFRIEPGIEPRLQKVAEKMGLPESWFINNALQNQMAQFEKTAEKATPKAAA